MVWLFHLSEIAGEVSIDVLLGGSELEVGVGVDRDKETLVLHAPLEFNDDGLTGELGKERLWVHWNHRHDWEARWVR